MRVSFRRCIQDGPSLELISPDVHVHQVSDELGVRQVEFLFVVPAVCPRVHSKGAIT